jgi:predicted enzyme related to lactoylglutathione lyase
MSGHGRFTWYDLMTTDPEGGKSFYSELVGWGTQQWEGPMPYSMWTCGGMPLGGVMQLPEEAQQAGAPPHWLPYVKVDDVDATVAKAAELGAVAMVPPQDIPNTGRFAVLGDPHGAVFAIFKSLDDQPGDDDMPAVGGFSWHELATDDLEAAWSFYSELFGWVITDTADMGEMGPYRMFSRREGTTTAGGIFNRPPDMPACWAIYVRVEDVNSSVEKVKELGGQVLNGPMEVPGGDLIAHCLDPQGTYFAMHSTAA